MTHEWNPTSRSLFKALLALKNTSYTALIHNILTVMQLSWHEKSVNSASKTSCNNMEIAWMYESNPYSTSTTTSEPRNTIYVLKASVGTNISIHIIFCILQYMWERGGRVQQKSTPMAAITFITPKSVI